MGKGEKELVGKWEVEKELERLKRGPVGERKGQPEGLCRAHAETANLAWGKR